MRRLLSALLVLCACAAAFVAAGARDSGSELPTYKVELDNAFGLVEGGDFRLGGVRAGRTTDIKLDVSGSGPPRAEVTAEVTEPGIELREDARCKVKPQSLVGEYFIDCQPGSSKVRLADGGTVPIRSRKYGDQTEATIPQDLVLDVLRQPTRERLRLLVTSLGIGVAGRPDDLQAVLRRSHPGLRETSRVLRILGRQRGVIRSFIRDADTVMLELEANKRDVVRFVQEAGDTAEIAASRSGDLREGVRRLPAFLSELTPSMDRLRELADQGTPLLVDLQRAAPAVTALLEQLGPFAAAARPALRELGDAARPTTQALREGKQELRTLRRLARDAPGLAKPLRQLVQSLDDRKRALEDDSRAALTSPPAPDPTHTDGPEGFTGFESIANYFFWQSMSANGFDEIGHILSVDAVTNDCSPFTNRNYKTAANQDFYRRCNSWMGPTQPGLNATDPSTPNTLSGRRAKPAAAGTTPAKTKGERRGPGQPEAAPLPGQRDISKPRELLPPGVKELLGKIKLPNARLPRTGGGGALDQTLLDYFLLP